MGAASPPPFLLAALEEAVEIAGQALLGADPEATPVPLTKKPKARPKKPAKNKKDGLLLAPEEVLQPAGVCPGGKYLYVSEPELAVRLLTHWADGKLWAAVDLETGCALRYRKNEETGRTDEPYYEAVPDPFGSPIFLASVSVEPGVAVVFDMRGLGVDPDFQGAFRRFLNECRLVCHNAAFEMSFFQAQWGTTGNVVYDTMLAHQLATAGKAEGSGLGEITKRFTGLELDKKWQSWFIKIHPDSPLCNEAIAYSAADVCQLLPIMQQVHAKLKASGQLPIWVNIERPFLPWLVAARVRGVAVDAALFEQLDEELAYLAGRAHGDFKAIAGDDVLISSWQQITAWFAARGIDLPSTNEETLLKVQAKEPAGTVVRRAIDAILAYRDAHKQRSTYIQPYLTSLPSCVTGRVHPNWKQTSTATGRMACSDPNLQNLPSRGPAARLRQGLIAETGQMLVWCDYSQFEVRALADAAGEIRMIRVFDEGKAAGEALEAYCEKHGLPDGLADWPEKKPEEFHQIVVVHPEVKRLVEQLANCDFHRRTAALLFKKEVAEVTKAERTRAKTVTFGVPYGAGPPAIAAQAGITEDEARQLLDDYYATFPAVKNFLQKCQNAASIHGVTRTAAGRLRFYDLPDSRALFEKAQAMYQAGLSDPEAARAWNEHAKRWFARTPQKVSDKQYKSQLGKIRREGSNHPIQGINADATKLATVLAGPRLRALDPRCEIIMWVHDEIVLTAPEGLALEAGKILQAAMVEAALKFLKRCPVETSLAMGQCWGK